MWTVQGGVFINPDMLGAGAQQMRYKTKGQRGQQFHKRINMQKRTKSRGTVQNTQVRVCTHTTDFLSFSLTHSLSRSPSFSLFVIQFFSASERAGIH